MADPERNVSQSLVQMTEIVLPEDSNAKGSIFGGRVLALIDKCAAVVAMRHARSDVVTGAMDSVAFLSKVRVGDVLTLSGRINAAFGSSMEVEVSVHAEDPRSGRTQLTTTALVTMVAVDGSGRPTPVAKLRLESEEEQRRSDEAHARRRARLAERT